MKIFTNLTREHLGGITTTNNELLNFLITKKQHIIGLEFDTVRISKGPIYLAQLDPNYFDHYFINIQDKPFNKIVNNFQKINDLQFFYQDIIESIKNLLIKTQPDLILINGTSFFPWIISEAAFQLKIPIILRYHGIASKENSYISSQLSQQSLIIEQSFFEKTCAFIFPSQICKTIVEKEVFQKEIKNYKIIPNPVKIFKNLKSISKKDNIYKIAMIARWHNIKNIPAFIKIHQILQKQKYKHEACLISELTTDQRNQIPKSIKIIDPLPYDQLISFYQQQDLIISPSHFETFGNVPMEVLSLGIPVLINKNMGCADILRKLNLEDFLSDFNDLLQSVNQIKKISQKKISTSQLKKLSQILNPTQINQKIFKYLKENCKIK